MVFQPVVCLATGDLHHFEGLARFNGDESPAEAIRLAEELDFIAAFDRAMFRRAAETLGTLRSVSIAVNVSGRSLLQTGFVGELIAMTERRPGIRKRLLVELTETHLIEDLGEADRRIAELRRAGHVVCLDDFGAGAASLDYLRRLRVDMVKLDGRYMRERLEDPRDAAVVAHVVRLCHALGSTVIAEMIETKAAAHAARSLGVDYGQGWIFGRPQADLAWPPTGPTTSRIWVPAAG